MAASISEIGIIHYHILHPCLLGKSYVLVNIGRSNISKLIIGPTVVLPSSALHSKRQAVSPFQMVYLVQQLFLTTHRQSSTYSRQSHIFQGSCPKHQTSAVPEGIDTGTRVKAHKAYSPALIPAHIEPFTEIPKLLYRQLQKAQLVDFRTPFDSHLLQPVVNPFKGKDNVSWGNIAV